VEANSTGGQGSRRAVAPSDDDDDDDDECYMQRDQFCKNKPPFVSVKTQLLSSVKYIQTQ
jgi:hypothetical protein